MKVIGYILPKKTVSTDEAEASEEEDEEEEKAPEFLDMRELKSVSSGGQMFSSSIPSTDTVELKDLSGPMYKVEGRFALKSPWWEVTCCVRKQGQKLVVDGFPSYRLRSDLDRQDQRSVVSLFLNACHVQEDFIVQFFEWLPQNRDVSIHNLMEVLGEFSQGGKEAIAKSVIAYISHSVAGQQVHASCLFPHIMKYLPTLLPGQFAELLGSSSPNNVLPATQATQAGQAVQTSEQEEGDVDIEGEDLSLLAKLEAIITNDVWKLGFNYLVYKELKLVRCEAPLKAFRQCNLLEKIPPLQLNALWVYEQLKKFCRRTGSTYMDQSSLCAVLRKEPGMSDEQAWKAIHFLKEQAVVVCDRQKVVLHNFHLYETGIAKCLRSLVESEPFRIHVNAREMLYEAAQRRKNSQKSTHPDENAQFVGSPSSPDAAHTSVPADTGESPITKSNTPLDPLSETSGQAAARDALNELDPDQVRAVEMICTNPVTVISGKGGCGKTTVISELFKAALQGNRRMRCMEGSCTEGQPPTLFAQSEEEMRGLQSEKEVLITAPTGKAASLLTKKTAFPAFTLHQVLFSFMRTPKDNEGRPKDWKFQSVRILVVDEGSLVCAQLLQSIISMLTKYAQLNKFIILGDVRQLPSIQPGNILHDLFYSLKSIQWAIEMRTNHRAESQLIVKNAGIIADLGMKRSSGTLEFDAIVDLGTSSSMPSPDKKFIFISLPSEEKPDDLQRAVKLLIDGAPGLQSDVTSQFIAFRRTDVLLINEICCKHYNNHTTRNHKNELLFQPGDKVCCTRNGYLSDEEDEDKEAPEEKNDQSQMMESQSQSTKQGESPKKEQEKEKSKVRLCNGEIFFIRDDKTVVDAGGRPRRRRYLTLEDGDGRLLTLDYRKLQSECRLRHSWARTIHTFQGSENETIVYVMGKGKGQTWKHVYTAVTRGQKRVYVVAQKTTLYSAIGTRETPRNTRLGALIKERVVQHHKVTTPHKTSPGCGPRQSTQTPTGPPSSCSQLTPLQPRRLLEADGLKLEAPQFSMNDKGQASSQAASDRSRELSVDQPAATAGNKRPSTEAQETAIKQPRTTAAGDVTIS